MIFDKCIEKFQ